MFISRVYRPDGAVWPWYTFLALELPLTVALLALFGIADPDTYRTKLWQDGADNGFNSSPTAGLYAAANYQPYKTPAVWSQWITSYNVVISVLSTFILLTKMVIFIVHCFPPLLSVLTHGALLALYAVSLRYQTASDMSDPEHPQRGPPWYITKPCSVAAHQTNVHYCEQAKSAFAGTCIVIALFTFQTLHGLYSLLCPSRATKSLHATKSARSKSAYAEAAALTPTPSTAHRSLFPTSLFPRSPAPFSPGTTGGLKSPPLTTVSERPKETWGTEAKEAPAMPRHALAGGLQPMTPRTQAFNRLGGTKDLPLRNHFSSPNVPRSPTFGVTSPLAATFSMGDDDRDVEKGVEEREMKPMYFPPPPKMANKANKK